MTINTISNILNTIIPEEGAKEFVVKLIDSFPNYIALLDEDRRIVYSNSRMLEAMAAGDFESILRLRPGDLFSCVNAETAPGGCGTSEGCELCGAMQSMIQSRTEGKTITKQFRVLGSLKGKTNSGIFRFTSTPFQFGGNFYYLVTLEDISHEIRKAELEQIFFHDMMNSIGGLHGVIDLLKRNEDVEPLYIDILEASYNTMYDTIREQKQYSQAESGQLTVNNELLHTQDIIIETTLPFNEKNTGKGSVEIHTETVDLLFTSDSALLSRVLINMIKNAVEASSASDVITVGATLRQGAAIKEEAASSHDAAIMEGTVNRRGAAIMDGKTVEDGAVTRDGAEIKDGAEIRDGAEIKDGAEIRDEKLRFWVHNPGFIPKETQLQIFERSFTTKGRGRGLGTFSMKLLGEHYLGGKVGFSSDRKEGTTFWIDLPLDNH